MIPEDYARSLVDRLDSLKDGEHILAALAACGTCAVEPLRRFLLHGKPSGVFQPRQRAVEALAELGAKDVLIEYLAAEKHISDPVDRYGEEAVRNTAARLLARWRDEDVVDILLSLLRGKPMPGVIDAVGEFRRTEAIPELIGALGDDVARVPAEAALRKVGEAARGALLDAASTPAPSGASETPSSLLRRRSALRLLADLALSREDRRRLAAMMRHPDPELAARACRVALHGAEERRRHVAVRRLLEVLPEAHPFLQEEIESSLSRDPEIMEGTVDKEIARRWRNAAAGPESDPVLRLLVRVRNRIGGARPN